MFINYVISLSKNICCLQDKGTRHYPDSSTVLTSDQIRKLNAMNKSAEFDSKYVGYLLSIIFGDKILKISSRRGTSSNFNGVRHAPLDSSKLSIVESMRVSDFQFSKISRKIIQSIIYFIFGFLPLFAEFYADRVGGDSLRKKMFWKFINKKCNLRRGN